MMCDQLPITLCGAKSNEFLREKRLRKTNRLDAPGHWRLRRQWREGIWAHASGAPWGRRRPTARSKRSRSLGARKLWAALVFTLVRWRELCIV